MSNLFSNQEVKETVSTGSNQKYIYGGIYHKIIVSDVAAHKSAAGNDSLKVTMHTEEGGPEVTRDFYFPFNSEKNAEMSKQKLKHIATKVTKEANFNNMPASSIEEYATNYAKLVKGKTLRMKFTAYQEEYNGKVLDKPQIGLPPFAEATQAGAEYEPIADADTKLVYDKENQYDYKKLDIQPDSEDTTTADEPDWLNG